VSLDRHYNIVTAKSVDVIDRIPYIFLEYVIGDDKYGADLNGWIHGGGLNLALALNFAIQFCRGMIHAQTKFKEMGKHFVHRDIKPSNIMVTCDKIVKVTDFGLAKASVESMADIPLAKSSNSSNNGFTLSKSGAIWGTPPYMSPEQCRGLKEIDTRSDIYSFGCVMYEMLTRKPVFEGNSFDEYIYKHLSVTPESPKCHDEVDSVILRCLEKDPSNRYQDFIELEHILSQLYYRFTGELVHTPEVRELDTWDLSNKGLSLVRLQLYKEAEACCQEALRANPNNAAAHHNLAISYYKRGRLDDATREYEQALKIEPSAYRVLFDLARLYQDQGKLDHAIATYQKALTINKNYVDGHNMLGTAYWDQGKVDEAILQYREALRINPNDATTRINLGLAFKSLGRLDEAIKEYKEAIRLTPNNWEAYYNLGALYQDQGKLDDAMREYMQVLKVNPDTTHGYFALGSVYHTQGNLGKAIEKYREALVKDPKYWAPHHNLGMDCTPMIGQIRLGESGGVRPYPPE
jgi:tetratricopeptide (TPR) repeat protein